MIPVVSDNVHSYGYDATTKELLVRFHSGGLYLYRNISQDVADYFNYSHPWSKIGSYLISSGGFRVG